MIAFGYTLFVICCLMVLAGLVAIGVSIAENNEKAPERLLHTMIWVTFGLYVGLTLWG